MRRWTTICLVCAGCSSIDDFSKFHATVDPTLSSVRVDPSVVEVRSPAIVTVQLVDVTNKVMARRPVQLVATAVDENAGPAIVVGDEPLDRAPPVMTDRTGQAVFEIQSTLTGMASLTAMVDGVEVGADSSATITFIPGEVLTSSDDDMGIAAVLPSTIVAEPAVLEAGKSTTITVQLFDKNGIGVNGAKVRIQKDLALGDPIAEAETMNGGIATFTFSSQKAGTVRVSAVVAIGTEGVFQRATASIPITFRPGEPASVEILPSMYDAPTRMPIEVLVLVRDANGNGAPGQSVQLKSTPLASDLHKTDLRTDDFGIQRFSIQMDSGGTVELSTADFDTARATMRFFGPPAGLQLTRVARGCDSLDFDLIVSDSQGQLLAGKQVSPVDGVLSPAGVISDADGLATGRFFPSTSGTPGLRVYTVPPAFVSVTIPSPPFWNNAWRRCDPLPYPREGSSAVSLNDTIYVFGGTTLNGTTPELTDELLKYSLHDPNSYQYLEPAGSRPGPRSGHTAVVLTDPNSGLPAMYVFGGRTLVRPSNDMGLQDLGLVNEFTNELWKYEPSSGWSRPSSTGSSPAPRAGHVAFAIGLKMYVHGGELGTVTLADLQVFETTNSTWSYVTGAYPPLKNHSATLAPNGSSIYLFGGESTGGISNTLYSCVLTGPNASCMPVVANNTPPLPRRDHKAALVEGKMYVFGGVGTGLQPNADAWFFDPTANRWSVVPSLPTNPSSGHLKSSMALTVIPGFQIGKGYIWCFGGRSSSGLSTAVDLFSP